MEESPHLGTKCQLIFNLLFHSVSVYYFFNELNIYKFDTMISRSVLSHPIDVSHGRIRASLDYFTEEANGISLRSHLRSQLLRLKEVSAPEKDVIFSVLTKKDLEMEVLEIFRELGLEDCLLTKSNSAEGPAKNMCVYEKII